MKQILQNLKNGKTSLEAVAAPAITPGALLIATRRSLVSAGTERMLLDFGKANLLDKARQQPDKVRMVLDKIRTDGLLPTIETVRNKLDQPIPLGYCNAGVVLEVGAGLEGFKAGDRVASNGHHAEIVRAPANLCALVPENVSDEAAAFTIIGAIALQGIRLLQPTLGEVVVVTGLGLVGLMTVQLLRAQGCRVLGIDVEPSRVALARQLGAGGVDLSAGEDPLKRAEAFSRGRGVDAVLITASTSSNEPVSQAAKMCRQRGRIVLVGVTGLELSRADFYEKELSFQISCSYGPGRYDPEYEDKGHDYPVGFVRWTEQRNMEAVLDMMASGALDVAPLISHRFGFEDALAAYALLGSDAASLGILLEYPARHSRESGNLVTFGRGESSVDMNVHPTGAVVGFIGAGNYSGSVLIPAFKAAGARLHTVASSGGVSGMQVGKKHGFAQTTTDAASVFADAAINTVVVATRHDSHAGFVQDGLRAGKHVFVEKPLCLTLDELAEIEEAAGYSRDVSRHSRDIARHSRDIARHSRASGNLEEIPGSATRGPGMTEYVIPAEERHSGLEPESPTRRCITEIPGSAPLLMVGFNRRFAPQVVKIKELLVAVAEPKSFIMTVNAGALPADHWVQDPAIGGGRIIGEACHFIDLLRFLAGAPIIAHSATSMGARTGMVSSDKLSISLEFADGSFGTVHYLANGDKSFPKERLEVFCAGGVLQLDNFRKLRGFGWPGFKKMNLRRQDKGQKACAKAFLDAVRDGGASPIPVAEIFEIARISIEVISK